MIEIKLTDLERRMLMVFCETEINKMILTKEIEYDENILTILENIIYKLEEA